MCVNNLRRKKNLQNQKTTAQKLKKKVINWDLLTYLCNYCQPHTDFRSLVNTKLTAVKLGRELVAETEKMNHYCMDRVLPVLGSCMICKCRVGMQNVSILSIAMHSLILQLVT